MSENIPSEVNLVGVTPPPSGAVIAIGVFDGVHLGHQKLLQVTKEQAKRAGSTPGVISFWPHPQNFFLPHQPVQQLTSPAEQSLLMNLYGISYFSFFNFTSEFAGLSATKFARQVLVDQLQVGGVVVGYNFRYGAENSGEPSLLKIAGRELGFQVVVVPPVEVEGEVVSSTRIRQSLSTGEVATAERLLGRPYSLTGLVVHGAGRGEGLGFPTVNLALPPNRLVPAPGVYAGSAIIGDKKSVPAAIFIGPRLTFDDLRPTVEAHLLDWTGDFYGKPLQLHFWQRIREIVRFSTAAQLQDQVIADLQKVRELAGK